MNTVILKGNSKADRYCKKNGNDAKIFTHEGIEKVGLAFSIKEG